MPRSRPRPFTLGDGMALIAALAFGFALARWEAAPYVVPRSSPDGHSWSGMRAGSWPMALWMGPPGCYAAAGTLALVALRWRRPRPPAARIIRQPGAVACLAAAGSLLLAGGLALAAMALERNDATGRRPPGGYENNWYWGVAIQPTSVTVAGAWLALALGGRWSPERSWIDRAGIALGVYWIARYPLGWLALPLQILWPYRP